MLAGAAGVHALLRPSSGELVVETGVQLGADSAGRRFYCQPEPSSIDY
jgi:hypothetical protein